MNESLKPGSNARRGFLRLSLAAGALLVADWRAVRADEAVEVKIDNFVFQPVLVRVKKNGTVTWINRDDIPHSIVCPVLNVHSHPIDSEEQFAFRFEKPGIYNYICGLHPHMHGQIVVQP